MISNLDQKVDKKKYDENFDKIFRSYKPVIYAKFMTWKEIEELYPPKDDD